MFSALFCLVLLLLIVSYGTTLPSNGLEIPTEWVLPMAALLFVGVVTWIALQNWLLRHRLSGLGRQRLFLIAQVELLFYFLFLFLGLRIAPSLGLTQGWIGPFTLTLVSLLLYFLGLGCFHLSIQKSRTPLRVRLRYAIHQLAFLIPFCIPFLLFDLFLSWFEPQIAGWLPSTLSSEVRGGWEFLISISLTLFFATALLIFFPVAMVRLWQCRPIPEGPLRYRLEHLCNQLNFHCAGLRIWPALRSAITAGIIGLLPRWRYVLFTEAMLRTLDTEEVEAVLTHEIGHSQHRHLVWYPVIIFGMIVALSLYGLYLSPLLDRTLGLLAILHPAPVWSWLSPLLLFLPYLLILVVYFRFFFGLFSRLFERQADLHILHAGIEPNVMISALDKIAVVSGQTHHHPSWHHYSLQQRIDFLSRVSLDESLAQRHHGKVRRMTMGYLLGLSLALIALLLPPLIGLVTHDPEAGRPGQKLAQYATTQLSNKTVANYIHHYNLPAPENQVEAAFQMALTHPEALQQVGVAEFYASQMLMELGALDSAAILLESAWNQFDFCQATPESLHAFVKATRLLLQAMARNQPHSPQGRELRKAVEKIYPKAAQSCGETHVQFFLEQPRVY